MKKLIRIIVYGTILVLTAIGVRECNVTSQFSAMGGGANSPDARFIAVGGTLEGEKFWGGKYTCYEFMIKTKTGVLISYHKLDNPQQPLVNWREDGDHLIQWATNSSSVTYNFTGRHLTLSVTP
jgi:hypothetical protein